MILEGSILTPLRLVISLGQSESGSPSLSYESELGITARVGEFSRDFPFHPRVSISALRAAIQLGRSLISRRAPA